MERWRTELGETFQASLFGPGELVLVSDPPSLKALFAADRVNTIAPGRNLILEPLLGSGSLLLQEGEEHLRRRKLMLPPFHGERMRAYEEVIVEATERAIASWPRGEQFAAPPEHAGDHPRGDPASRVRGRGRRPPRRAPRRPGRDPRLDRIAGRDRLRDPRRAQAAALSPPQRAPRSHRRGPVRRDRRSPPRPGGGRARGHPLAAGLGPVRGWLGDGRLRAARPADDPVAGRPRDHGHRPRLGVRSAPSQPRAAGATSRRARPRRERLPRGRGRRVPAGAPGGPVHRPRAAQPTPSWAATSCRRAPS